jgi:hypothetical protein
MRDDMRTDPPFRHGPWEKTLKKGPKEAQNAAKLGEKMAYTQLQSYE